MADCIDLFRALAVGLILLVTATQSSGVDHAVYVRLVDARSGRPVPEKTVEVSWFVPHQQHPQTLRERADRDGVAVFHLTDPVPGQLSFDVKSGYWDSCSPGPYDSSEVLMTGVSKEGGRWAAKFPNVSDRFHPKQGEVFLFICHVSFGEWLREYFKGLE